MGGISNNLDLQRLNATQQTGTRSVKPNAFKSKDPRMSMNGSIFAGQVGNATKGQATQSTQKDYSDISKSEAKQMQSSKLEDISFDKRFNVHTKDQVEARYLLTTGFMDRLNSLETAFGSSNKIKCSFFDDKIMFAIPNKKDLFELGSLFTPIGSTKSIEKFCDELTAVEEIIDHFKLNEHIGL